MSTARLQARLDQILATTRQRWALILISSASIVLASAMISTGSALNDAWLVIVVGILAVLAAAEPDEDLGLVLIGIVVVHWLVSEPEVTSPRSIALAVCLHVFHTVEALMAVTPHSGILPRQILVRWASRSIPVLFATVSVWMLVVAFERREAPGSVTASAMAFGLLAVVAVAFRARSLAEES